MLGEVVQVLAVGESRIKAVRSGRITHGAEKISDPVRFDCKLYIDA